MRHFPLPVTAATQVGSQHAADTQQPVLLIGFLNQGNLGLGYLSSMLRRAGYRVVILDIEQDDDLLSQAAHTLSPLLIGFSLIFQFYLPRFASLAERLRSSGQTCHFTIGGHFPSLNPTLTLEHIPHLDSVVRFEGEQTLLELVGCLDKQQPWRDILGIAYRQNHETRMNPLRPLLSDLDALPYPDREHEPETILGQRAMPLLASRGCARTCSFCSIHTFYRQAPGKVVRTRQPAQVIEEMHHLHHARGINIFLFQDDDFPLYGKAWQRWARQFVAELRHSGLAGQIAWKINCRADAVDEALFSEMRDAGLYLVYMGLESGSEHGLQTLNKQIDVEQNHQAVAILKKIGLMFEFGFMLFDPSSTLPGIRDNIRFLKDIVGDGSAAAVFCRMLPYEGTPIKSTLEAEGRMRGDISNPDYDFLDPRIEKLYEEVHELTSLAGWVHGHRSLAPKINWAWNELAIIKRLFPSIRHTRRYQTNLRTITRAANQLLFTLLEDACKGHEHGDSSGWTEAALGQHCDRLLERLLDTRNRFIMSHQHGLTEDLRRSRLLVA